MMTNEGNQKSSFQVQINSKQQKTINKNHQKRDNTVAIPRGWFPVKSQKPKRNINSNQNIENMKFITTFIISPLIPLLDTRMLPLFGVVGDPKSGTFERKRWSFELEIIRNPPLCRPAKEKEREKVVPKRERKRKLRQQLFPFSPPVTDGEFLLIASLHQRC